MHKTKMDQFLSSRFITLLIVCLTASATTGVHDPNTLTKCGDTIEADSGRIEYKVGENYDANELCSFIVRTTDTFSSGLVFELESHGFNATADPHAISIFTFDNRKLLESTHLGPPNPLTKAFIPGGLAVIVFKTQGNKGTGFKLSYRSVQSRDIIRYGGENLIYSNATGNLTIPFWPNPAYKTSVIVLSPNHKKIDRYFKALRVTFLEENLQKDMSNYNSCSYDSIRLYSFAYDKITEKGIFCSLYTQKSSFDTAGLMILVFRDFEESYWNKHEATFKWEIVDTETPYP